MTSESILTVIYPIKFYNICPVNYKYIINNYDLKNMAFSYMLVKSGFLIDIYCVKNYAYSRFSFNYISEELDIIMVNKDFTTFKYLLNPSLKVMKKIVKKNKNVLFYIPYEKRNLLI